MKFPNAIIYRITNDVNTLIYYGSSIQTREDRWENYDRDVRYDAKPRKVIRAMREIGIEHFKMEVVEVFPCDDAQDLKWREGEWIKETKSTDPNIGYNDLVPGGKHAGALYIPHADAKEAKRIANKKRYLHKKIPKDLENLDDY